jgi:hypothetical protein
MRATLDHANMARLYVLAIEACLFGDTTLIPE